MTPPKPANYRAKRGRKTKRERAEQIKMLEKLARTCDITAWQASLTVRCGYEFAVVHMSCPHYLNRMILWRRDKFKRDEKGFPPDYTQRINRIMSQIRESYRKSQSTKGDIPNYFEKI